MISYCLKIINTLLKAQFIKFCLVGALGFFINYLILYFLNSILGLYIFVAQLIGSEIALFINFLLHHNWTYKEHLVKKTKTKLLIQFHLTSWPAIVGSAVMVTVLEKIFHLNNLIALGISSFIALMWNFLWSKHLVWRRVKPNTEVSDSVGHS
jgi:dolichol-phosphate mannosyltransferase